MNPPAIQETPVQFLVGQIPWRRERLPIPLFWPGEFYELYSPWGRKESNNWATFTLYLRDILMCLDVKLIQYESYYSVFYPFLNIVLWVSFSVKTIGFLKIIQLALLLQIWAQFFFILTFIIEIAKKLVFYFSIYSLGLWTYSIFIIQEATIS